MLLVSYPPHGSFIADVPSGEQRFYARWQPPIITLPLRSFTLTSHYALAVAVQLALYRSPEESSTERKRVASLLPSQNSECVVNLFRINHLPGSAPSYFVVLLVFAVLLFSVFFFVGFVGVMFTSFLLRASMRVASATIHTPSNTLLKYFVQAAQGQLSLYGCAMQHSFRCVRDLLHYRPVGIVKSCPLKPICDAVYALSCD